MNPDSMRNHCEHPEESQAPGSQEDLKDPFAEHLQTIVNKRTRRSPIVKKLIAVDAHKRKDQSESEKDCFLLV